VLSTRVVTFEGITLRLHSTWWVKEADNSPIPWSFPILVVQGSEILDYLGVQKRFRSPWWLGQEVLKFKRLYLQVWTTITNWRRVSPRCSSFIVLSNYWRNLEELSYRNIKLLLQYSTRFYKLLHRSATIMYLPWGSLVFRDVPWDSAVFQELPYVSKMFRDVPYVAKGFYGLALDLVSW
jgi:hypothetical protein